MHIQNQIKSVLRDLLVKSPINHYHDRIVNQKSVKNVIIPPSQIPQELKSQSQGGLLRILAKNEANAKEIAERLKKHQDSLPIQYIYISKKALEYRAKPSHEPVYRNSIIVKLCPKALLRSATSLFKNYDAIRAEILEHCGEADKFKKVLIDFSSPNIAKPFHFGHLKSTIVGNYLANLNEFLGNRVVKLNYLGDWGTQYGLLNLGLETFGEQPSNNDVESIPTLRHLLNVYVKANERARKDDNFYQEAKRRFLTVQNETDSTESEKWRKIRDLSLEELQKSYSTLGIEFDVYEYESDHVNESIKLAKQMLSCEDGFVTTYNDGAIVAHVDRENRLFEVPLVRSDGASLYIARDIAAAISRKDKYNWDKMHYVVGADQEKHFYSLKQILRRSGYEWWNNINHIKMGKVMNMSSRSGNSMLLSDIIEEATKRYIESTRNTPTSKVTEDCHIEEVAKQLALSALFLYDMRNGRTKNYEFDWGAVMFPCNRSGINLQTTFARLSSLLEKTSAVGLHPIESPENLDYDAICCEEGVNLLSYLDELHNELHSSYWSHDPNPLVDHAFKLCKAINRARQSERLQVLTETNEKWARTRLSLFKSSHSQLEFIIKMIGLKPLHKC